MSVEGPRVATTKRKDLHLETVAHVTELRREQRVVVWDDFPSDGQKPVWMQKGDIGTVESVDAGGALICFHAKDRGGRSLPCIIKRKNWVNLRMEVEDPKAAKRRKKAAAGTSSSSKTASTTATAKSDPAAASPSASPTAVTVTPPPLRVPEEAKPLTEKEKARAEAAAKWLAKEPKKGTVRYTFKEEGPLGLRFSKDIPPWILVVSDGSPAAKKAPRVPVAGIVIAINGYEITEEKGDMQEVMQGLKKRPVILDIDWPVDQDLPIVNRA
mmetsp:Transcript_87641/g.183260  ORF Transcript_87641/g.183260 Transcript_87641/m.183260 type:complete len:270 (+) Transcript_87641:83-892(+)